MNLLGVDNVFLPVGDLAEAVAFYETVLGFPVAKRFDEMGTVLLRVGDETPGLGLAVVPGGAGTGNKVWFEVPDARVAAKELEAAGLPMPSAFAIPTGWAFEITDPWGNVLGFTDYTTMPELARGRMSEVDR